MKQFDVPFNWGIACEAGSSNEIVTSGDQTIFEASSSIKSAVGLCAIEKARSAIHDPQNYYLTVGTPHYSNGSGRIKNLDDNLGGRLIQDRRKGDGSAVLSLLSALELNTINSDCIATNVLIDYIDGKDTVNQKLQSIGCENMELLTDHIDFPGVNHSTTPFQVGTVTPQDLARYYQHVRNQLNDGEPLMSEFYDMHQQVGFARMFGLRRGAVPESLKWAHKTGSMFDYQPGVGFYACVIDGGLLATNGSMKAVAFASSILMPDATESLEREFCKTVATQNVAFLEAQDVLAPGQIIPFTERIPVAA